MLHWKLRYFWCPKCYGEDVFYKYDEEQVYPHRCWYFFCECNECGHVWETGVRVTEE